MSVNDLIYRHVILKLSGGQALGCSYRWPGGQYCVIHTDSGILACGLYDCKIASEFGLAVAVARGTPENPLCEPEELLKARVAEVSRRAEELGIEVGMSGEQALTCLFNHAPQAAG